MNRKLYIITLLVTALMSCHSSGDVKTNQKDSAVLTVAPTDSSSGRTSISSPGVDSINGEVPIAVVVFDCDSGNLAKITFWKDRCRMEGSLKGQPINVDLPQMLSGSGVMYSNGKQVVWNKGNDVLIDLGDGQSFHCTNKSAK